MMKRSDVSIPYWLGSKLRGGGRGRRICWEPLVSIPYWLGSKLREYWLATFPAEDVAFQSPIGWGLSCELTGGVTMTNEANVSIPYWLGSKLRDGITELQDVCASSFNPLLVGV